MPDEYKIIIGIVIVLIVILVAIGLSISLGIIKPKRRSLMETSLLEEDKFPGIMSFYSEKLNSIYKTKSSYNYDLTVYYLEHSQESKKFLVMSHGHTYTHHGCLKYARMMMKYGYNIILYDQRFHGDSGGSFTSLGYYEKDDLYDIISDTIERYGSDIEIGTYGESMGATTVLLEANIDQRVKYIFADCGFENLDKLVQEISIKKAKFPLKTCLFMGRFFFKIFTGVKMSRISPIDALITIDIPVFFAHGKADNFIDYHHTENMFEIYSRDKQLFLANNDAKHAEAYLKDSIEYEKAIEEFIIKYIKMQS